LGLIGAATFLGMAIGPLLGAVILELLQLRDALASIGIWGGSAVDFLTPGWRWVFYVTVPLSLLAGIYIWAASPEWDVEPGSSHMDAIGAALFGVALTSALLAITLIGDEPEGGIPVIAVASVVAVVTGVLAIVRMLRVPEPFLDLRLFANRVFSGAVLVSLLTGYALATAIVGMAAFIDRVRFAGPEEQGLVLGPMALWMAIGAFASGFMMKRFDATLVTLVGIAASVVGLVVLSTTRIDTDLIVPVVSLSLFGVGFGLTVTPRSTAAVEAAGRAAFGAASAAVTVARMAGMAIGMAVLTAFGTTRIDTVSVALNDQEYRDSILPPELVGQPLGDPLVLHAIEQWASATAAEVLGALFVVAAIVLVIAALPAWWMREQPGADVAHEGNDELEEGALPGF
jgi:MFS family permease